MDEAQIKHMVDRFLAWRLPSDFSPDGGISYANMDYHAVLGPTGTNLLDATQAEAMVCHMVEGLPAVNSHASRDAALEEARGALEESKGTLRHARTFIRSREVMALTGRELYAETQTKVDAALATINAALGRVEG